MKGKWKDQKKTDSKLARWKRPLRLAYRKFKNKETQCLA